MSVEMTRRGGERRPGRRFLAVVVTAAVVLSACSDDSDDSDGSSDTTEATEPGVVADSDEVVTDLPQDASLALVSVDGQWYVENDGNVTMSDVVVLDGSETLCELGTVAPGDRSTCDETAGVDAVSASGVGPQGQSVEVSSDA